MKSILLIGLSNFGLLLLKQLSSRGHEIMAVDRDEDRINLILPLVTDAQIGDSTNEAFLRSLGINNYDLCIVAIGKDLQSSLETTSLLRDLHAHYIVSRADKEVQEKLLLRNGADEVIYPEKQIAEWAAIRYASNHLLDYVKLDNKHGIYEVAIPPAWIGRKIEEINIRKKYGINIMAIKDHGRMNLTVTPETALGMDKTLLVLGEHAAVQKCFHI